MSQQGNKTFYVTTPIYYASGKPHIGHAYTTIAADVLARYYRKLLGEENVYFLTGTDEHGLKVAEKAKKMKKTPKEFVDNLVVDYKDLWQSLNISNNDFIRTTDEKHKSFVKKFVVKLKEAGVLYEDEYEGLYCIGCEKFLQKKDLNDEGKCVDHLTKPELVKEKNWFFDLNGEKGGRNFLAEIKALIESGKLQIAPDAMKQEVLGLLKQGMPNFSISRNKNKVQWGIELPWDSEQLVYVWADALSNYISALQGGNENFWPANVQLLGKDILKFHMIYWPAMLMAIGYELPEKLFAHGHFTVDGQKMSKTIGNVIDPKEMVEEFGSDVSKYLLLSAFPFGQDGDIAKDKFKENYNAFFANHLGNFVNRVLSLVYKNYDQAIPQVEKFSNSKIENFIQEAWQDYHHNIKEIRLDRSIQVVSDIIRYGNEYITELEIWKLVKEDKVKAGQHFYDLTELLRHLVLMLEPILPESADKIKALLNWQAEFNSQEWGVLPMGHKIEKPKILFPRLK